MLKKYNNPPLLLICLVLVLVVIYPDITWLPYDMGKLAAADKPSFIAFFSFRYLYFVALLFLLLKVNFQQLRNALFKRRFVYSFVISMLAWVAYGIVLFLLYAKVKHFGSLVLFQFFFMALIATFMGHMSAMYKEQRKREVEIAALKVENLKSRYDALTNQINPHFFFNSLNGLTSLIRKQNNEATLTYVNKLSDVFRYILQSDKKGLVSLGEELAFVDAFRYMMEVRFANKLAYRIDVPETALSYQLPVLAILPLLDNIVVHNRIDSEHKMLLEISFNEAEELVISNPIYPKLSPAETNGTGLQNLESRFQLLMDKQLRVVQDTERFTVYLPLKKSL